MSNGSLIYHQKVFADLRYVLLGHRGTEWQDVSQVNRGHCQSTETVISIVQGDYLQAGTQELKASLSFPGELQDGATDCLPTLRAAYTTLGIQFVCIELFSIQKSSNTGSFGK